MSGGAGWIRSPAARTLLWTALVMSLALGAAVVAVSRPAPETVGAKAAPMTDSQAVRQVLDSARQIAAAAQLQEASGGYSFVSCTNEKDPPYQVALYMSFQLPESDSGRYLNDVAAAMIDADWTEASAMGENFGRKMTKDGVTSVFYRTLNEPDFATMRLYGECRATADHRHDNPAWTEVRI
jgi:hypothetical protein